ncbi:MAG: hypothetical protein Kow0059_13220 [Candidatus Sumerlaeia bacterium]
MKKIWIAVLSVVIVAGVGFALLNLDYYRGGGLAADVEAMRAARRAAQPVRKQVRSEAREKSAEKKADRAARQTEGKQAGSPSDGSSPQGTAATSSRRTNPHKIDLTTFFGSVKLTEAQQAQAEAIVKGYKAQLAPLLQQQASLKDATREAMISALGGASALPDPAWEKMTPARLMDAVEQSSAVADGPKTACASLFAAWKEKNKTIVVQIQLAKKHATRQLIALLDEQQRSIYQSEKQRRAKTQA